MILAKCRQCNKLSDQADMAWSARVWRAGPLQVHWVRSPAHTTPKTAVGCQKWQIFEYIGARPALFYGYRPGTSTTSPNGASKHRKEILVGPKRPTTTTKGLCLLEEDSLQQLKLFCGWWGPSGATHSLTGGAQNGATHHHHLEGSSARPWA